MNKAAPRVRFAPSPTGFLHLGNIRTALLNWLFAQKIGAQFLLRLDDTDRKRSEERFVQALLEDLAWMGLTHDTLVRQSERATVYAEKIATLKSMERLYACYETPEELEIKRKLQLSRGKPPLYDRAGLHLSQAEREAKEAQGRKPHWRFLLKEEEVTWNDLIRGPLQYDVRTVSDPIVMREDGTISFLLAGAIDDQDLGITHILRGEDHITNTAVQIQLMETLRYAVTQLSFGHFSWITDAQGKGFSKRLGSLSLQELRQEGMFPLVISSFLTALGTAQAPQRVQNLNELVSSFDLHNFGRATPKLDVQDMWQLQTKFLHTLSYTQALPFLKEQQIESITPELWESVRESLSRLEEVQYWKKVCEDENLPTPLREEDVSFFERACETLPPEPWDQETWGVWTQALKEITGRSGKNLYHPLREKITGLGSGPEMKRVLPLVTRSIVLARLKST